MQEFNDEITIAIPVFERYDYFEDAIGSAINQSIPTSIIVVDNNSSHDKFKNYVEGLSNPNIRYYKNSENVGMVDNWNRCIELTRTRWLTILHSDDMLSPLYIENAAHYIETKPNAIAFASDTYFGIQPRADFDNPRKKFFLPFGTIKPNHFLLGNPIPFPGVIFNKENIGSLKFRKEMYPIADYVFWYSLSTISPLIFINRKLAFYRISSQQETGDVYLDIIQKGYTFKKTISAKNKYEEKMSDIDTYISYLNYSKTHNKTKLYELDEKYSFGVLLKKFENTIFPTPFLSFFIRVAKRVYISLT